MKRESRFVNLQSAAKEIIILVTVCAPSEGQSLHFTCIFIRMSQGKEQGLNLSSSGTCSPTHPTCPVGPAGLTGQ